MRCPDRGSPDRNTTPQHDERQRATAPAPFRKPERSRLTPRTSALANVELPLTYAGLQRADRRRCALAALRAVGMGDGVHHQPSKLSGGQQQRVAVARAIVTNPAIVLADEPTGNLDSHSTAEVLDVFARLNDAGRTVVMITHEQDVAAQARRVIRLGDGEIISDEWS